jgi:hypothetical protein
MDAELKTLLDEEGYLLLKEIPGVGICGVRRFLFTWGLMVGLDRWGYSHRYCYESGPEAAKALGAWDGKGDPEGPWIKRKGLGMEDKLGPGALL